MTALEMDDILAALIYAGRERDAVRLAETMVQWWLATGRAISGDEWQRREQTEQFYFWLGIRRAITTVANVRENKARRRKEQRAIRRGAR